jgi:rhamnose transport system substrate-binding protein
MAKIIRSRREFIKLTGSACGGLLLTQIGCGDQQRPAPGSMAKKTGSSPSPATPPAEMVIEAVQNLTSPNEKIRIGCSWGLVGHPYWDAVSSGVEKAGKRWGYDIRIGGPTVNNPRVQIAEVETWIAQKLDAIVYQAVDAEASVPTIRKAVSRGIPIITIDSDAHTSNRTVFNNQANDDDQTMAMVEHLAGEINGQGEWAFIVGEFTQAQKMYQVDLAQNVVAQKYPAMKFTSVEECKDDESRAADIARQLIVANPGLKGIIVNSGAGLPGTAQGVRQAGKSGQVKVTGISVPSLMKTFIDDGTVSKFFLWDPGQLGYRAIAIVNELLHGRDITTQTTLAKSDDLSEPADIRPNLQNPALLDIILGPPLGVDKSNIGQFGF